MHRAAEGGESGGGGGGPQQVRGGDGRAREGAVGTVHGRTGAGVPGMLLEEDGVVLGEGRGHRGKGGMGMG